MAMTAMLPEVQCLCPLRGLQVASRASNIFCTCASAPCDQVVAPTQHLDCRRRGILLGFAPAIFTLCQPSIDSAIAGTDPRLMKAFQTALAARDFETAESAWSKAIEIAPDNAPAYSNRGSIRLQYGRWQAARDDFAHALEMESSNGGEPSAVLLNSLGNAEGALGEWDSARRHYQQAADDPEMEAIATANAALAAFEVGDNADAIRTVRQLLRRDANFMDMRAALAAFLWATGESSLAEGEWETLQDSQNGLGAAIYSRATAVQRVRNRWPPRPTAALQAFLTMASSAEAEGYDGKMHSFSFR